MGYALMWLESLAAAALFFAVCVSWQNSLNKRWLRYAVRLGLCCIAAGPIIVACTLTYWSFYGLFKVGWSIYVLLWVVGLGVIAAGIVRAGSKNDVGVARSGNWPRARLFLGAAAAAVLTSMTFWNIDTAARLHLAALAHDADVQAASVSPGFVPDSLNAALVYEKAFAEIKQTELQDFNRLKNLAWPRKPEKGDAFLADPQAAIFLAKCQQLIALVRKASAMPNCSFDHDYAGSDRLLIQLPELTELRTQAQLLGMDARFKAAHGKVAEAFEDIAAIDRMAAQIGTGPFLIAGLLVCALEDISTQTLERVLATAVPSSADLTVMPAENPVNLNRIFHRSLKGEEALALSAFSVFADGRMSDREFTELKLNYLAPIWRVFLMPDDVQAYESFIAPLVKNSKDPLMKLRVDARESESHYRAFKCNLMTSMTAPALQRSVTHFTRTQARQRLSQLALGVAAYQAKHAKLPENLEALVPEFIPEIPNDPFTETPLHFKKKDDRILLYSAGANQLDDGGIETEDTSKGDIVFTIRMDSKTNNVIK